MGGRRWTAVGLGNLGHGEGPPRYTFEIFLNGGHGHEPASQHGLQWILLITGDGPVKQPRLMLRYASEKECEEEARTIMHLFWLSHIEPN